jgi:hypothetical protein
MTNSTKVERVKWICLKGSLCVSAVTFLDKKHLKADCQFLIFKERGRSSVIQVRPSFFSLPLQAPLSIHLFHHATHNASRFRISLKKNTSCGGGGG